MGADGLAWIGAELQRRGDEGLRRQLRCCERIGAATAVVDGRKVVNFSSNDYLALASSALNDAVIRAVAQSGWGSGASPLVTGRTPWHAELEQRLAQFEGTESALVFPTGYAANVGAITALVGRGDTVFSDALNHASIIDGCRLSRAELILYPHGDMTRLEKALKRCHGNGRRLIVSDGLFSMGGDLAPLHDLVALAERYDAMTLIDEAHATGVFGARGRGTAEYFGVESRITVRVGTLSKALGSLGGFVTGPQVLVDWLVQRARSYVYSTAMPAACAAAGMAALDLVQREPHRRSQLLERSRWLREALSAEGFECAPSASHIIPVHVGDADRTMAMSERLVRQGILVAGIRPPSVPKGNSLLRISVTYGHTQEMLEQLVEALRRAR